VADVSARMLALLSALQTGRAFSSADLAARLGTSGRTLRRDVDRLRALGYPVEARPGPGGHYRLVAGTAMPPLLLEDDEAVAIAVGLQLAAAEDPASEAARRALRKLTQLLPARLARAVDAVEAGTEVPATAGTADTAQLRVLVQAVQRGERVGFGYRSRDRVLSDRTVDPVRVVRAHGHWYLVAWDVDRADWRTFRLDRITGAAPTGRPATPRELPAESGAAYLDASLGAPRHRAVLELDAPPEELAGLLTTDGDLERLPDGRSRFTTRVDSFAWLAVTTALLDVGFRVVEPAEFAVRCRELRDRFDTAAGPSPVPERLASRTRHP
jgi:predicted DNA-binding transcriptional regulator YafY